jgi:hypothetical protein
MLLLVFCLSCLFAVAEPLSEDELERLQDGVRISSVNDDTVDGDEIGLDEDTEFVQLKFYTYQDEDDAEKYTFYMRVTVEMTDKKTGTICYAQFAREQGPVDPEYTGEDNWQFVVSQGDMQRPKVTAYAVQYGVIVDGKPVFIAEELDDVDSVDEIIERTPTRLDQKPQILHQYSYRDSDEAVQTSQWD